jgi:hypothetical protein
MLYEGVECVCYHYYQMVLRVSNLFIQTRSNDKLLVAQDRLPKTAYNILFSPPVIMFTTIIYNYNN